MIQVGADHSVMMFKQFDWQYITVAALNPPTALTYYRNSYFIFRDSVLSTSTANFALE